MLKTDRNDLSCGTCRSGLSPIPLWQERLGHAALGLAVVLAIGTPARADTLVLQGSTTFNSELIMGREAEVEAAAHHHLEVIPNKSNLGLVALLQGSAQLAMISTMLDTEVALLRQTNPELDTGRLRAFPVSRTVAAIVAHESNRVHALSHEALKAILTGAIVNWRDVGGPDLPIRVVAVREGGGVVSSVETTILGAGKHITAPEQIRVQNGSQILRVVEQEPGALGITQSKIVAGRDVTVLQTTPVEQLLSLVTVGEPTPAMSDVISAFTAEADAKP